MDPNLIRHLEYFSVPNNQTINSLDRAASIPRPTTGQQQSLWGPSGLGTGSGSPLEPTASQTASSFNPFQPSTDPSFGNLSFSPPQRRPPNLAQGSRTILPTRTPKPKGSHERKRPKLSTESTPFDSVDYWLQFDEETNQEDAAGTAAKKVDDQSLTVPGRNPADRTSGSRPRAGAQGSAQAGQPSQEEGIDDSALDNALSDLEEDYSAINLAEQLSNIDSVAPADVPQREGLYSTPLSWERPQPGLRMDSLMSTQNPSTLDQAEQRRLIAIALNTGPSMGGLGGSILDQYAQAANFANLMRSAMGPPQGTTTLSQVSNMPDPSMARPTPSHQPPHPRPQPPQRQGSTGGEAEKDKLGKSGDRTAHNDIERKYRTNLKDKISELRDAVPALRTIPENAVDDGDDGGQPSRGPKVSKGTVLTKATEYIHYLEKKNQAIVQQHQELSRRLQAFEQLLSATARPTYQMPNYSRTLFDPRAFC